MPFVNFKTVNDKNLKMEFKKTTETCHIYSLRFWSLADTRRYKRGFVKKTSVMKLKSKEKSMTLSSLLMFSSEFHLERELCNTSVLSSHTWIKT